MNLPELNDIKSWFEFLNFLKFSGIFVFAYLIFYFLVVKYFIKNIKFYKKKKKKNLRQDFEELKEFLDLPRGDFYHKMNQNIRLVLNHKYNQNTYPKTLKEIDKLNIDPRLKKLFSQSYLLEYSDKIEDNWIVRQKLINDILNQI